MANWKNAEKACRKVLDLKPSHAELCHVFGHYLMAMRRIEESSEVCKRALALDPVGVI